MTEQPQYPEHIKMQQVKEQSQIIGEFLESLSEQDLWICENAAGMHPTSRSIQDILARYFDIDLKKIDQEKKQMLDNIRRGNERERELND